MDAEKTLVVVLCMHRCGSSFVTNLLARLGMSLGPFELVGRADSNKYGHFEPIPFTVLNRRLQEQFLGFPDDVPGTPEVLARFCRTEGQWPPEPAIPAAWLDEGRELIGRLVASGPIAGFKDPRTALVWPFWRRVLAEMPGLRVVPVFVIRSPHEIAMSLFTRSEGSAAYSQALALVETHFKRMWAIREEFGGDAPVIRFDPRTLPDEARRAAGRCGLRFDESVLRDVYDPDCRHHESLALPHPAQEAFERLLSPGDAPAKRADLPRLFEETAGREEFLRRRVVSNRQEIDTLRRENWEQVSQLQGELHAAKSELAQHAARVSHHQGDLSALQAELHAAKSELAQQAARVASYRQQLDTLRRENWEEVAQLQAELHAVKSEFAQQSARVSHLQGDLSTISNTRTWRLHEVVGGVLARLPFRRGRQLPQPTTDN